MRSKALHAASSIRDFWLLRITDVVTAFPASPLSDFEISQTCVQLKTDSAVQRSVLTYKFEYDAAYGYTTMIERNATTKIYV
jgi:hypothetical protein